MWEHCRDDKRGWKYTVTSNRFVIRVTGGSITMLDRQTGAVLRCHKGYNYLYTGDISPDEKQCFALENGKHFYVYSLENYDLIKRITLPRGYDCIDLYGHYTPDGAYICIPARKWVGEEAISEGYYEYILCRYDAKQLTLVEKTVVDDPDPYWWEIDESSVSVNEKDAALIRKISGMIEENAQKEGFLDRMLGLTDEEDPAVAEIMSFIFGDLQDKEG